MKIYKYLLCITLFLLPFSQYLFSVEIGIITFNIFSLGLFLVLVLAIADYIFSEKTFSFTVVDLLILLFCLTFFVSTFLAKDFMRSSHMAYKGIFIPIVTYFVLKLSITNEKEFNKIFLSLLAGIILFAVLGIVQGGSIQARRYLFGLDPVGIATFLILPIITISALGWWRKKIGFISLIVCLALFVLTFSRVYFIAVLISPVLFFFIKRGHLLKIFILFFPLTLMVILMISFNHNIRYKYVPPKESKTIKRIVKLDLYKAALSRRARQYNEGFQDFIKHPLLGTGIKRGRVNVTTHNFHIEWLEYGGIIAYFIGTGIFFTFFLTNRSSVKDDPIRVTFFCLLLIILMNCTTNGIMHGVNNKIVFILMGMIEARRIMMKSPDVKPQFLYGFSAQEQFDKI